MTLVTAGTLILASASPRRHELLKSIGLDFTVEPGDVDETYRNGELPRDHALRLAREKALVVSSRRPRAWVLAADTIVVVGGEVLGKPRTAAKAGGYAVQGQGAFFIKEIRGSYTNVMGLPLAEVMDALKRAGIIRFSGGSS